MKILLAADLLLSLLAFALYAWDKVASKNRGRRISERNLHVFALLGGWPGALIAQRLLRHKTAKPSFQRAFRWTVFLNVVVTIAFALWYARR